MGRKTFRNIITSEELVSQINSKNKELMESFLKSKSVNTSNKTIIVYRSNLHIFFVWNLLHNSNKEFTNIKKLEFSNFFYFASEEMKLGSARLNNIRSTLSSLSSFIERLMDEEFPDFHNAILKTIESAPKEVRREKTILTDEQVENLLNHLTKKDRQQTCWVALAVTSGARFTELQNFEVDLIDENRTAFADLFLETSRKIKTKGRGRGGKLLYKYILKEKFLPYYKEWIKERETILKLKKLNHNYLFIKEDGNPATGATIRGWIDSFEKYLGVPVYAHSFRHYLVTLLSKKNIPPMFIKEIFGWSSLELVSVYDDTTISEMNFPELENLRDIK